MRDHDPPDLPELRLLDQAVVDDDAQLAVAVDALVLDLEKNDPEIATLHRELLAAQARLQALAPEPVWLAYLELEQATNARAGELLLRVFRAGYAAGAGTGRGTGS